MLICRAILAEGKRMHYGKEKRLGKQISPRNFLKKNTIVLGTVAACDFKGIGSAEELRCCDKNH
jgi:hypothetical protein